MTAPHLLFKKIERRPYSFFLDSAMACKGLGRRSFMGSDPFLVFKSKKDRITLEWLKSRRTENLKANPFIVLKGLFKKFAGRGKKKKGGFSSGAVGYFGYDMKDFLEKLPDIAADDARIPDCILGFYDNVMSCNNPTAAVGSHRRGGTGRGGRCADLKSNFSKKDYIKIVGKAKEYIRNGDIYQVNLSQRFEADLNTAPYELYLRLRRVSPAPFSSYLNFGDVAVISSSPERFLMKSGRYIETRPIKGTRPRSPDPLSDRSNAKELVASPKDRAEHIMIVDLERNDLGRICEYGSVKPSEFISLEKYSNVFHLVSTVSGKLKKDVGAIDCLMATFPGGSITGAPKIRSMEIIEELEPVKRSVYTGAIGYISFDGDMDMSIAIRTIVAKKKKIYFQVGGGIVADSDPEAEYDETLDKAAGILRAINAKGVRRFLGSGLALFR